MMTTESWAGLHDATLESMELFWSSGGALLRIRTVDPTHPERVVVASAVRRVACDRQLPWGFSVSINEVRPRYVGADAFVLEIENAVGKLTSHRSGRVQLRHAESLTPTRVKLGAYGGPLAIIEADGPEAPEFPASALTPCYTDRAEGRVALVDAR